MQVKQQIQPAAALLLVQAGFLRGVVHHTAHVLSIQAQFHVHHAYDMALQMRVLSQQFYRHGRELFDLVHMACPAFRQKPHRIHLFERATVQCDTRHQRNQRLVSAEQPLHNPGNNTYINY